jgi:NmrA-like family
VDIEDVAAVAAVSLLDPEKHHGQTYRMGYEALTYDEIAEIFTKVLDQDFSYEARPPEEFYENVLAAGAEPAYMKCVFNSYSDFTAGRGERAMKSSITFQPSSAANRKRWLSSPRKTPTRFATKVIPRRWTDLQLLTPLSEVAGVQELQNKKSESCRAIIF